MLKILIHFPTFSTVNAKDEKGALHFIFVVIKMGDVAPSKETREGLVTFFILFGGRVFTLDPSPFLTIFSYVLVKENF